MAWKPISRCGAKMERRLTRANCDSPAEAAAFSVRLRGALAFEPGTPAGEERYSPVVMTVVAPPHPVTGSDTRTHLVYEIQLTNASPAEWPIVAIEVLDGDDPEQARADVPTTIARATRITAVPGSLRPGLGPG